MLKSRFLAFSIILTLSVSLARPSFDVNARPLAATTPSLGIASTFGILAGTYTNTASGTTINGDLGYTTAPATAPTVTGSVYTPISPPLSTTYADAGTAQGVALTALSSGANLACTFSFAPGAIDLATDVTNPNGPGNFTPGVWCITGAASIGTGGITLTGSGTYIFRMTGALTTDANSAVTTAGGASACDVFWTPGEATTLGANSTFLGTDIDASGITIGSTVTWLGRALAFGGTVSTDTDTITVPTCAAPQNPAMTVVKSSTTTSLSAPGTVSYSYLVTNTGDVTLTGIGLSDNNDNNDMSCPFTTLAASDMTCSATHTFTQAELNGGVRQHGHGFLNETPRDCGPEHSNPAEFGADPGQDHLFGEPVQHARWDGRVSLLVTNTGNVSLGTP